MPGEDTVPGQQAILHAVSGAGQTEDSAPECSHLSPRVFVARFPRTVPSPAPQETGASHAHGLTLWQDLQTAHLSPPGDIMFWGHHCSAQSTNCEVFSVQPWYGHAVLYFSFPLLCASLCMTVCLWHRAFVSWHASASVPKFPSRGETGGSHGAHTLSYLMGVGSASSTHLQASVSPEYSHPGVLLSVKYYIIVALINFLG